MANNLTISAASLKAYLKKLNALAEAYYDFLLDEWEAAEGVLWNRVEPGADSIVVDWDAFKVEFETLLNGLPADASVLARDFVGEVLQQAGFDLNLGDFYQGVSEDLFNTVFGSQIREESAGGSVSQGEVAPALKNAAQIQAAHSANQTVWGNVNAQYRRSRAGRRASDTGLRYAMVPQSATPCAFCIMIASRGAVYWENRSNQNHPDCKCIAVPCMLGGTIEGYEEALERFERIYAQASRIATGTSREELAKAIRDLGYATH